MTPPRADELAAECVRESHELGVRIYGVSWEPPLPVKDPPAPCPKCGGNKLKTWASAISCEGCGFYILNSNLDTHRYDHWNRSVPDHTSQNRRKSP